jgi:hypothetical protein
MVTGQAWSASFFAALGLRKNGSLAAGLFRRARAIAWITDLFSAIEEQSRGPYSPCRVRMSLREASTRRRRTQTKVGSKPLSVTASSAAANIVGQLGAARRTHGKDHFQNAGSHLS